MFNHFFITKTTTSTTRTIMKPPLPLLFSLLLLFSPSPITPTPCTCQFSDDAPEDLSLSFYPSREVFSDGMTFIFLDYNSEEGYSDYALCHEEGYNNNNKRASFSFENDFYQGDEQARDRLEFSIVFDCSCGLNTLFMSVGGDEWARKDINNKMETKYSGASGGLEGECVGVMDYGCRSDFGIGDGSCGFRCKDVEVTR